MAAVGSRQSAVGGAPPAPRRERLTSTQRTILEAAAKEPDGAFFVSLGDRRGTRVSKLGDGCLCLTAYGNPEIYLLSRGLVERDPLRRWFFRITEKGRAAVGGRRSAVGGREAAAEVAHAAAGVDRVVIEHAEASTPVSAAMAAKEVDHG